MKQRIRVMSGVQPSGDLHIGNWLGAIRRWAAAQDEWHGFFCIVDLHALTEPRDPALLHEKTLEVAAIYLACGLDPARSRIFLQSHVSAHSELAWLLDCFLPMGWLERMTQFKVRSRGDHERASVGLFNYPALMAADILLYQPELVPVGEDQRQHVEVTRDVAQRINRRFGELLTVPEAHVGSAGARIMGLDDPAAKMSKSAAAGAPNHAIAILDSPDAVRRKLGRAVTDGQPEIRPPLSAGVANLIEIYRAAENLSVNAAFELFEGRTYADLKRDVADAVVAALEPVQTRYPAIRGDEAGLHSVLAAGASAAIEESARTLSTIREAVGLVPRQRTRPTYNFGHDRMAARRLRLLDEAFRPTTEDFLRQLSALGRFDAVIDLGCGPGTTTGSIQRVLHPTRLVGEDHSPTFIELAREEVPEAEFINHDVLNLPWPVQEVDLIYARYLLTHLRDPEARLSEWVDQVRNGGVVAVEDDLDIDTTNASLGTYCSIVDHVLSASGADLFVARMLDPMRLGLEVVIDRQVRVRPSTALIARIFRLNLAAWSHRPAAAQFADRLRRLETELRDLEGSDATGECTWTLRQLAVRRPRHAHDAVNRGGAVRAESHLPSPRRHPRPHHVNAGSCR